MTENKTTELWIPEGSLNMSQRDSTDQLKIAIVGPQKGGKSRLAATAPRKPIYVWDFDDRIISVAGMPGVMGKTYRETSNLLATTAWPEVMQDMNMFEYHKAKGDMVPATMVFDSMTYMMEAAMRYLLVSNSDMRREIVLNKQQGIKTYVPYKYDPYKAEFDQVSSMLTRALELGCDLICCFHERPEEAPDSTQENPKYTGKLSTHPPRAAMYLPKFNELWRISPDSQAQYKVQVKPDYQFVAASAMKGLVEQEVPDISKLVEKHLQNKGK
jgi:AAA domain